MISLQLCSLIPYRVKHKFCNCIVSDILSRRYNSPFLTKYIPNGCFMVSRDLVCYNFFTTAMIPPTVLYMGKDFTTKMFAVLVVTQFARAFILAIVSPQSPGMYVTSQCGIGFPQPILPHFSKIYIYTQLPYVTPHCDMDRRTPSVLMQRG